MNVNPVISILVADRLARLRDEADEERLAVLARSASNRRRSRQEARRTRYARVGRLWLRGAVRVAARAVGADRQADCPEEAPSGPSYPPGLRWAWTPDRPNSPCP
jgi:hypothetical protein